MFSYFRLQQKSFRQQFQELFLFDLTNHKQLQPKPYNYEIATRYNFNVSLFERLINNKIIFSSLKYQRRMKTKFADFVRIIYGDECKASSV